MFKRRILLWWFIVSLLLAGLVSPYASQFPDGLEKIASDLGFIRRGEVVFRSPIPDYSSQGSVSGSLPASLAGAIGTVIVFAVATLLARIFVAAKFTHKKRG